MRVMAQGIKRAHERWSIIVTDKKPIQSFYLITIYPGIAYIASMKGPKLTLILMTLNSLALQCEGFNDHESSVIPNFRVY